jgi:lipopolysaccharide/colanic/teichoic acid biosynthesis glycosyltransferase
MLRPGESSTEATRRLLDICRSRLRVTDEIGWLTADTLAIVLPETPPVGAWKVADDLCVAMPDHLEPPACRVYFYPSGSGGQPLPLAEEELAPHRSEATVGLEGLFCRSLPVWKRALDLLGGVTLAVAALPALALIAAAVKLASPGPVLFRQLRAGLGGRPFVMYKFRTMTVDAESLRHALRELNELDGPAFKIKADPRVTRLGRLLRSTSLDELPQLWNVIRGDMSLVGPRPLPCDEQAACTPWQQRRLDVTPGLTCIWQISGRSNVSFAEWVRMDLQYANERSLGRDLQLLAATVPAVLVRRGAY